MTITCQHPYVWLKHHLGRYNYTYHLSKYRLIDARDPYYYGGSNSIAFDIKLDFQIKQLNECLNNMTAQPRTECGILAGTKDFDSYISMFDLIGRPSIDKIRSEFSELLGSESFAIFDSGSSYHVYGSRIISGLEYRSRCRTARGIPIIDQKWLRQPTHVLRWTANNKCLIVRVA